MWHWVKRSVGFLLLVSSSFGEVRVKLQPSATVIRTADQLSLRLSVDAPMDIRVALPEDIRELKGFTLLKTTPLQRQRGHEGIQHACTFLLEPFLPGEYSIPVLSVWTTDALGQKVSYQTEPLTISVRSVIAGPPAEAEMMPIADDLPSESPPYGLIFFVLILVLILVVMAAAWLLKSRRKPVAFDHIHPHQPLLDALATLPDEFTPAMLAACVKPTWRDPAYQAEWRVLESSLCSRHPVEAEALHRLADAFREKLKEAA
jgi:hypothetical protein